MSKKILITAAIKDELNPIREHFNNSPPNKIQTDFLITGIGRQNTLKILDQYFTENPLLPIINIGTCGSLSDDYKKGQLMMPKCFTAMIDKSLEKLDQSHSLPAKPKELHQCVLFTSEKALYKSSEKFAIRNKTNADIVDMEAFWIAAFCNQQGVPFIALKVVSDDLKDFTLTEFKQELKKNAELLVNPVDKIVRSLTI